MKTTEALDRQAQAIAKRYRNRIADWDRSGHPCSPRVSKEGVFDGHLSFRLLKNRLIVYCTCGARKTIIRQKTIR